MIFNNIFLMMLDVIKKMRPVIIISPLGINDNSYSSIKDYEYRTFKIKIDQCENSICFVAVPQERNIDFVDFPIL